MRGSFIVARGFIGGALLLVGAALATLAIAAFFQYRAEAHNDRASAQEPSAWQTPSAPSY